MCVCTYSQGNCSFGLWMRNESNRKESNGRGGEKEKGRREARRSVKGKVKARSGNHSSDER